MCIFSKLLLLLLLKVMKNSTASKQKLKVDIFYKKMKKNSQTKKMMDLKEFTFLFIFESIFK